MMLMLALSPANARRQFLSILLTAQLCRLALTEKKAIHAVPVQSKAASWKQVTEEVIRFTLENAFRDLGNMSPMVWCRCPPLVLPAFGLC